MQRLFPPSGIFIVAFMLCLCPMGAHAVRYGTATTNDALPSVVEIYKKTASGFIVGSGVLYRPDIVITAAHVVTNWTPASTQVVKWNDRSFGIAQVVLNPHLRDGDDVDLAVVKLSSPIDARTATLSSDVPAHGELLTIAGYGQNGRASESNDGLGKLRTGTAVFDAFKNRGSFINGALEIFAGDSGMIACEGDSGGPAFLNGNVVGIFYGYVFVPANAKNPCKAEVSTTYISVATFRQWIDNTASDLDGTMAVSPIPPIGAIIISVIGIIVAALFAAGLVRMKQRASM